MHYRAVKRPIPLLVDSVAQVRRFSDMAMSKILKLANGGHAGAQKSASYFVGQGVGMMNSPRAVRETVRDFMEDYLGLLNGLQNRYETELLGANFVIGTASGLLPQYRRLLQSHPTRASQSSE
jgi:hypothetical protein